MSDSGNTGSNVEQETQGEAELIAQPPPPYTSVAPEGDVDPAFAYGDCHRQACSYECFLDISDDYPDYPSLADRTSDTPDNEPLIEYLNNHYNRELIEVVDVSTTNGKIEQLQILLSALSKMKERQRTIPARCSGRGQTAFESYCLARYHSANMRRSFDMYTVPGDKSMGPVPEPEAIMSILYHVADLRGVLGVMQMWNVHVVGSIFDLAFQPNPGVRRLGPNLKAVPCPSPISEPFCLYYDDETPTLRPNYCILISQLFGAPWDEVRRAIQELSPRLPGHSINPLAEAAFANDPVAIMVGIQQDREFLDYTCFKLAMCVRAQIHFLDNLIHGNSASPVLPDAPTLSQLGILPAVLVAHDTWHLIIAKPRTGKTIIWLDVELGHIGDVFGLYRIVAGLQLLRTWVLNTYLPWIGHVIQWVESRSRLPTPIICWSETT